MAAGSGSSDGAGSAAVDPCYEPQEREPTVRVAAGGYFVIRFLNHIFFDIKLSYFVIRLLLSSSIVKSDNEIGKINDKKI